MRSVGLQSHLRSALLRHGSQSSRRGGHRAADATLLPATCCAATPAYAHAAASSPLASSLLLLRSFHSSPGSFAAAAGGDQKAAAPESLFKRVSPYGRIKAPEAPAEGAPPAEPVAEEAPTPQPRWLRRRQFPRNEGDSEDSRTLLTRARKAALVDEDGKPAPPPKDNEIIELDEDEVTGMDDLVPDREAILERMEEAGLEGSHEELKAEYQKAKRYVQSLIDEDVDDEVEADEDEDAEEEPPVEKPEWWDTKMEELDEDELEVFEEGKDDAIEAEVGEEGEEGKEGEVEAKEGEEKQEIVLTKEQKREYLRQKLFGDEEDDADAEAEPAAPAPKPRRRWSQHPAPALRADPITHFFASLKMLDHAAKFDTMADVLSMKSRDLKEIGLSVKQRKEYLKLADRYKAQMRANQALAVIRDQGPFVSPQELQKLVYEQMYAHVYESISAAEHNAEADKEWRDPIMEHRAFRRRSHNNFRGLREPELQEMAKIEAKQIMAAREFFRKRGIKPGETAPRNKDDEDEAEGQDGAETLSEADLTKMENEEAATGADAAAAGEKKPAEAQA